MTWELLIFSKSQPARGAIVLLAFLTYSGASSAATVAGRVELVRSTDPKVRKHQDYSGVVVWLEPLSGAAAIPVKAGHAEIIQKNKTFSPHVLAISAGSTVDFPNYDPIFHNAFSNYDGQIFDIGLYPPGTTRSIAFRRAGVVRVFCNIHPAMSAVIVVLKSPYFAVTNRSGVFEIPDVPPGSYRLQIFHERATERTLSELARTIEVTDGPVSIPTLSVSESGYLQPPHKNKYGIDYPPVPESGTYPGSKP